MTTAVTPHRKLTIGLALFAAVNAFAGGAGLTFWGDSDFFPRRLLAHTPFDSFLIPGLILGVLVGGANLVAAILWWKRSGAAADVTLLSGGALTLWILAEAAMFREIDILHVVFGALGIAILSLGVRASLRSTVARHRWIVLVTAGEAIGYLAPALTGILTTRAGTPPHLQATLLVMSGCVEGFACGMGQAFALRPKVRKLRFALLTAGGAGLVWAAVVTEMALGSGNAPIPVMILVGVVTAIVGLGAIGSAQWMELRHHMTGARTWIGWTALAWALALPLSFSPAPFVDEQTPLGSHVVLWSCGGLLMAYVMALVTWQGARRLAVR